MMERFLLMTTIGGIQYYLMGYDSGTHITPTSIQLTTDRMSATIYRDESAPAIDGFERTSTDAGFVIVYTGPTGMWVLGRDEREGYNGYRVIRGYDRRKLALQFISRAEAAAALLTAMRSPDMMTPVYDIRVVAISELSELNEDLY